MHSVVDVVAIVVHNHSLRKEQLTDHQEVLQEQMPEQPEHQAIEDFE